MKNINPKLSNIHIEAIKDWDKIDVLLLYPNDGVGIQSMSAHNEESFNSAEFWSAMKILDDLEVPRGDPKKNESFSIVGRIKWLAKQNITSIIDTIIETNDEAKIVNGIRIVTFKDGTKHKQFYYNGECLLNLKK